MPESTENMSTIGASETTLIEKLVAIMDSSLGDRISQSVNTSITNVANSVADIISNSFNDSVAAIEADIKELKQQVERSTVRLKFLRKYLLLSKPCLPKVTCK